MNSKQIIEGDSKEFHEIENALDTLAMMFPSFDNEVITMIFSENKYSFDVSVEILLRLSEEKSQNYFNEPVIHSSPIKFTSITSAERKAQAKSTQFTMENKENIDFLASKVSSKITKKPKRNWTCIFGKRKPLKEMKPLLQTHIQQLPDTEAFDFHS